MNKGFRRNNLKYSVDEQFFDKWTPQMAYILGFTFADGNIYKTSLSWDLQTRDLDILVKINSALKSNYPIKNRKSSVRLRINNQILIKGAIKNGLLPKKNLRDRFPEIPKDLVRHFIRGYLEGDGWVVVRKNRNEVDLGFASGTPDFLELLNQTIGEKLNFESGRVRKKIKITPHDVTATTYQLEFYSSNAIKLARWLYQNLSAKDLYLDRKYRKYLEAKKLYDFLESGTRKVRVIQKQLKRSLDKTLYDLYVNKHLNGVQIAETLEVHPSSIYRWLARFGIKYPVHRKIIYEQN